MQMNCSLSRQHYATSVRKANKLMQRCRRLFCGLQMDAVQRAVRISVFPAAEIT